MSEKLTKGQRKALQSLAEVEHAELSNKTGQDREGHYIHRGSGVILISLGLAEHYKHDPWAIRITPAGLTYLSALKGGE